MKEFNLVVRCDSASQLADALSASAADIRDNPAVIDAMGVDEEATCDAPGCEEVALHRSE